MEVTAALHFLLKYMCLLPFFAITTVLILRIAWRPGFCFMIPSTGYSSCSSSLSSSSSSRDRVRLKIGQYRLPRLLETEEEEKQECVMCLCGMEDGCEVWELQCKHLFHKGCLDKWVNEYRRVTCPLCRSALVSGEEKAVHEEAEQVEDDEEEADSMVSLAVYMGITSRWLWW